MIGLLTGEAETLDLPEHFLQQELSLYVTLLFVGLVAWVWYWRQIQQQVDADESGEEQSSLVRRIYLYAVASASVIAVVIAIGTLLYEALRSVLGIEALEWFDRLPSDKRQRSACCHHFAWVPCSNSTPGAHDFIKARSWGRFRGSCSVDG